MESLKKFYFESNPIEILNSIEVLFGGMAVKSGNIPFKSAGLSIEKSAFLFRDKKQNNIFLQLLVGKVVALQDP